jgi:hypothetical protein
MSVGLLVVCWGAWGFRGAKPRRRGVVCACLGNAPRLTAAIVPGKPSQMLRTGLARHAKMSTSLLASLELSSGETPLCTIPMGALPDALQRHSPIDLMPHAYSWSA